MPRCDLDPDLENRIELEAGEGNDWRESREKSGASLSESTVRLTVNGASTRTGSYYSPSNTLN